MSNWVDRITVAPKQCGGRPCVRDMRIRVSDMLNTSNAPLREILNSALPAAVARLEGRRSLAEIGDGP